MVSSVVLWRLASGVSCRVLSMWEWVIQERLRLIVGFSEGVGSTPGTSTIKNCPIDMKQPRVRYRF